MQQQIHSKALYRPVGAGVSGVRVATVQYVGDVQRAPSIGGFDQTIKQAPTDMPDAHQPQMAEMCFTTLGWSPQNSIRIYSSKELLDAVE
jgi:hypothetical protein